MSISWYVVAMVLSGAFSIWSVVPYVRDMLQKGDTKPNAVSFFLWTVLQIIAVAAQFKSGASLSVVFMLFTIANTTLITVLALIGYGYKKYGVFDVLCFVFAVIAIVGWWLTGDPVVAIAFSIIADMFAAFPTIKKAYLEPRTEHPTGWGLITLSAIFGVLSTEKLDAANVSFPLYLVGMNGLIFCLAYFGRKWKR